MESLEEKIRSRLRQMCKTRHGAQKELAEKAQVTPQYFNKVLSGREPLSRKTIDALSSGLGIDLYGEALAAEVRAYESRATKPLTLAPETVKSLASELNKFILPPMTSDEAKTLELLKEDARAANLFSLFLRLSERGRDLLIRKAEDLLEVHPAPPRDR